VTAVADSQLSAGVEQRAECPRQLPSTRWGPLTAHAGVVVVPLAPVSGVLCVYPIAHEDRALRRLQARQLALAALLTEPRAVTLARLLNARGSGDRGTCDGGLAVLVRLLYQGGRAVSATAAGCDPERLAISSGSRLAIRSTVTSDVLSGLLDLPLGGPRTITPDFVGRQLTSAVHAAAHAHGVTTQPGVKLGELVDPTARFERILWQDPLPNTRQDAATVAFGFIVAVPRARSCRAQQLTARYRSGGSSTGLNFGSIDIVNRSATPCTLRGALTLTGLTRTRRPDTYSITEPIRSPTRAKPRRVHDDNRARPERIARGDVHPRRQRSR
jgi:hypothetical protein